MIAAVISLLVESCDVPCTLYLAKCFVANGCNGHVEWLADFCILCACVKKERGKKTYAKPLELCDSVTAAFFLPDYAFVAFATYFNKKNCL